MSSDLNKSVKRQMFYIYRTNPRRRGKRSTRNTAEKRKRRLHLSQTWSSINNRSFTVPSSSWQLTSVMFAFDFEKLYPSSFGHHASTRDLQTCNAGVLWVKWSWERNPSLYVANTGTYLWLFVFFITMPFVDYFSFELHSTTGIPHLPHRILEISV